MLDKISEQAFFIYDRDLEYILGAQELLKPLNRNKTVAEVLEEPESDKYLVLKEVYQGFGEEIWGGILEPMEEMVEQGVSLALYEDYLKHMEKKKFLSKFLQLPQEEIQQALESSANLMKFYQNHQERFSNYLSVERLFERTEWFLDEFFSYVRELKTEKTEKFLQEKEEIVYQWKEEVVKELKREEPLAYSEKLMEKSFYRRGPYEKYFFMPSFFIPVSCCRWFGKNQILIFDAIRVHERGYEVPQQLKMLSDNARFRILKLLKENGHLSGIEIAEKMNLATSTVSHHMTQMKNCGLVHEEPVKNTKYFSLNEVSIKNCIQVLQETFL